MGRRKIEIQPLTDDRNRTVTFVKRKAGLFKKAHELAVLCQVDLAVIIIGNNKKLYEFSSVDTNELINVYKNIKMPHESKSPENYGNYKKKKHLNENKSTGIIHDDVSVADEEIDSDYNSDSPEPKRRKRSYYELQDNKYFDGDNKRSNHPNHISLANLPNFNPSYRPSRSSKKEERDESDNMSRHKRDDSSGSSNQRPVLRVQIPTDSKGSSNDSAKTITAIDTNLQNNTAPQSDAPDSANSADSINANNGNSNQNAPSINTPKYSSFNTFKSPETKKSITTLPLPIQSKSQTSSPSSATAPQLPVSSAPPFFSSMTQPSPSSQYPSSSVLPTPLLNQVFNQQYIPHSQPQQLSVNNNSNNENAANYNQQNNMVNVNNNHHNNNNGRFRPPVFTGNQFANGDQTPVSGLPSRYVNDIFPSPSNMYVPQDWPISGSGMTPIHNNLPQYFMNMLPTGGGGGGASLSSGKTSHVSQQQSQQLLQHVPQSQVRKNDALPSPLQFIGPFNTTLPRNGSNNASNNSSTNGPNSVGSKKKK